MALKHWIWLTTRPGIGSKTVQALIEHFDSPEHVYFATEAELRACGFLTEREISGAMNKNIAEARRIVETCAENGFRIITIKDAEYPERLRNIYDPPTLLYIAGVLPQIDDEAAIAVVGTRKCTPYGIRTAEKMGYELARAGGLVVSGLARGIDSAAAKGALRAGGSVIGVLGTGVDVVYPPENRALFKDVMTVGALISEYPPGTTATRGSFPARNRIMSGISVGVVVIEAPKRSGALITASRALEQGRDVFAVPGNVDADACVGSNELLREGALVAMSGRDVMAEYAARFPEKFGLALKNEFVELGEKEAERLVKNELEYVRKPINREKKVIDNEKSVDYIDLVIEKGTLSENEQKILSVLTEPEMQVDDIILESELPASAVLSALTLLQIKGAVRQSSGKRFTLAAVVK